MFLATAAETTTNPSLGVLIFTLGGLAGAVFYLPFKKVQKWAWESYWMIYAVAGLVLVPWILALTTSPNVFKVLSQAPGGQIVKCFMCGAMWGVGGLTWGLMIRYLGVGLGLAIGCGLCSATGTLIPPILNGNLQSLCGTPAANMSLIGVAVSVIGIVFVGLAGMSKENELPEAEKKKAVAEYDFKKGILVAFFSGIASAGMSFGLQGGPDIEALAKSIEPVTPLAWAGMPVLVVVLLGGFVVNAGWCLFLNSKNKSLGDYTRKDAPMANNLFFAGLAGAIWCSQFICFKTGEPQMGSLSYIGWAVLMASAILFSTLLGILLGEWKGTSSRTRALLAIGLVLLIGSSVISAYSGYLKA
ncbi:MAG TPA: L-rhamnose/proton symporter RhaT [Verrucomicrobiae bacterium]|nr:L-rhamnose/proton symporter RhaT [Verrucomicrobiae bacterium]